MRQLVNEEFERIRVGLYVNDVVDFDKEWCVICAKARWHEVYGKIRFCLWCGRVEEPQVEAFSVDSYVKGEEAIL
jgi:hypothetical protein